MSVFEVYQKDGGAKFMRLIHNREEYLGRRNTIRQRQVLKAVRQGKEEQKSQLIQMNYSCLPNEDGALKGEKKVKVYMTWTLDGLRFLNSKLGYPNF